MHSKNYERRPPMYIEEYKVKLIHKDSFSVIGSSFEIRFRRIKKAIKAKIIFDKVLINKLVKEPRR